MIEMHAHTSEGSPCGHVPAVEVVREYQKKGFGAVVITNHFDEDLLRDFGSTDRERMERYLLGCRRAAAEGDACGIRVFFGMEIRIVSGPEDFLIYGAVPDFVFEHPDLCRKTLPQVHDICRRAGALLIQAHPFRSPCRPQNAADLDGIEVHNAHPQHRNRNEMSRQWAADHPHFILTSGSDYHDFDNPSLGGITTEEDVSDEADLARLLREGRFALRT